MPSFQRKLESRLLNGIASGDALNGFDAAGRAAASYFSLLVPVLSGEIHPKLP
jgi:hypothetical protein